MMIKANGEYLDFDGDITVSKSVKLIEAVSENKGDFSYSFTIQRTSNNIRILKLYTINQSDKLINRKIDAIIESNGAPLYIGFIVVNRENSEGIECSFFSGNTNWFTSLEGTLYDLDYTEFNAPNDLTEIVASWTRTSGIVYPIIDKGVLSDRLTNQMVKNDSTEFEYNDFHPFIYVKDMLRKIGLYGGIKFTGDLFNDAVFQKLIVTSNPVKLSTDRLNASTSFVGRTSSQTINTTPSQLMLVDTDPFLDGANDNWDNALSRWTADQDMQISVSVDLEFTPGSAYNIPEVYKNGVINRTMYIPKTGKGFIANVDAGDYYEFNISNSAGTVDVLTGSSITFTPIAFRTLYLEDFMPSMKITDFVSSVFMMFNVVTSFDTYSKTVNATLFNNIKERTPIDLSEYVSGFDVDYDLVRDNFFIQNNFVYQPQDNQETEDYNKSNPVAAGAGQIVLDTDILEQSGTIVESPAIAPISYYSDAFGMWLTRLDFVSKDRQNTETAITSVTDQSPAARFNYPGTGLPGLATNTVVEIFDTEDDIYEGVGVVYNANAFGPYFQVRGVDFIQDQTGMFSLVSYVPIEVTDPIFLINSPDLPVSDFSRKNEFFINGTSYTSAAYAYFYKPKLELPIDDQIYSLSFGRGAELKDYQTPLIEHYYGDLITILNDPQAVNVYVNLPFNVFLNMDLLSPVRIKKAQFNSLFYVNRIVDYIESCKTCTIELIKLV